jgi:uncharacterized protein (DUF1810 family)
MDDPFDLQRFVEAQDRMYDRAVTELRAGTKHSHWIWFIFPQLAELGSSSTARLYGIKSLAEAQAYLAHPVLGTRLHECTQLLAAIEGASIKEIFPWPDNLKVCSSMTLFVQATADNADFLGVLEKFYGGEQDAHTLELL